MIHNTTGSLQQVYKVLQKQEGTRHGLPAAETVCLMLGQ